MCDTGKKGFFAKVCAKIDKKMKEKASQSCCCCSSEEKASENKQEKGNQGCC